MKFPKSTPLAKFNAFVGCAAFIIFIVAVATNYWLQKDFMFPVNAAGIATIPVEVNMGLFTACKVEHYPNNKSSESCSPDGAAEWQFISAGLSIVGLVFGLLGAVLTILGIVVQRLANNVKVKLPIVMCYFLACDFCLGPLIMFPINRKIQIRPNMSPFQVDFDLAWSYVLAVVSVGLFAALLLMTILDIIWSHNLDGNEKKEDRQALSKDRDNVT